MAARAIRAGRGASLIFAMALILLLAVVGVALVRYAGTDRVQAAQRSQEARSLACAEAGIQFGRRYFGCRYLTSNNWNDFLAPPGNRTVITGKVDGSTPGTDFEVSVQDDDDERPEGQPNDPARDNNLTLLLRSRCTAPAFARLAGEAQYGAEIEVRLVYIPTVSEFGSAPSGSNANEAAGGGAAVQTVVADCP